MFPLISPITVIFLLIDSCKVKLQINLALVFWVVPYGIIPGSQVPYSRLQQESNVSAIAKPARTNFVLACQSICTPGRLETRIPSGKHARGTI